MPKSYLIGGKGQGGLQTNVKPFWLTDQAYQVMTNCFAWRERIRKKPGWKLLGRLKRATESNLGTLTTPWQVFTGVIPNPDIEIDSLQVFTEATITGATQANPCVITVTNNFQVGQSVFISGVGGMTELNGNTYEITARTGADITINVNSSAFAAYTTGGTVSVYGQVYRTITAITNANPAVVTSNNHNIPNGTTILIRNVEGLLNSDLVSGINNQTYVTANATANTFELVGFDSSSLSAYSSSGTAQTFTNIYSGNFTAQFKPAFTGNVTILTNYEYYPRLPVQGIVSQELPDLNIEEGVFFDTTYAYYFTASGFLEFPSNTPTTWTNTAINSNYFWYTNYYATVPQSQALWVTNNLDNIRYYDSASNPATWTNFAPSVVSGGGTTLNACLLLTPFKGYLIAFNTLEGSNRFRQRARWCQNTLIGPPTASEAWWSDVPGRGGFIDAPIGQAIVSLKNLKDRLIVYFERSTWEFVFTGNDTLPFIWRQLNQELGSESTFSTVPFDNGILAIGNVGVHTCNGVNVVRIDEMIPDEIFSINNTNDGPLRVSGVRDYQLENVYWTYPDSTAYSDIVTEYYPNKILCYNYRNQTWAIFDESFTVLGYFAPNEGYTWDTLPYETWNDWDEIWNSGLSDARNPVVCAGNQQGFVFSYGKQDSASTDFSRYISAITGNTVTSPNHNLKLNDFIVFNYNDILGVTFNQTTESFQIIEIVDKDQFKFDGSVTGSYLGNGLIKKLDNFNLTTKEFNPFAEEGQQVRFSSVDFLVDAQDGSGFEANFYLNDSQAIYNPPLTGTNEISLSPSSLVPIQSNQSTIWKRKNINAIGQYVQIEMQHSNAQMRDPNIPQSDFVLHALNLRLDPSGRINPS